MLRACQRDHGKTMLVGTKLRRGFVRWVAGRNEKNAIEMKPPLGSACHGNVAGVNGVKRAAKKRDVPACGPFRAASGDPLGFQICSADLKISLRPKLSSPPGQAMKGRRQSLRRARLLRSLLPAPGQAARVHRPCRERAR